MATVAHAMSGAARLNSLPGLIACLGRVVARWSHGIGRPDRRPRNGGGWVRGVFPAVGHHRISSAVR